MTGAYTQHLRRWRELIDLVMGEATVKDIRRLAGPLKTVPMPRSEWGNRSSPFILLRSHAVTLQATPAGRARLKELANECLMILGDAPPAPPETTITEQAWQRRADIGD